MKANARPSRGVCALVLLCCAWRGYAQAGADRDAGKQEFRLDLPVDEVVLTFHATDAHGLPVNDIRRDEIKLWDNGVAPRRIVAFDSLLDRPMRVGFLLDTSESMERTLAASKAIAARFAAGVFRQRSDAAFVMDFGYGAEVPLAWTNDSAALAQGVRNVQPGRMHSLGGTALIDAVFRACFSEFGHADRTATANMLVIFSDGEDNASHTSIDEALGACQETNTAIYAFRVAAEPNRYSTGARTLQELASRSGGQVFPADDGDEAIWNDLKTIESETRNEYRLVYDPAQLKHDGRFHEIEIQPPDRVSRVKVRTGYYAPKQ